MKSPSVTQRNLRMLLPTKIAKTLEFIIQEEQCSSQEALLKFYASRIYALLEREESKTWWMSPLQLYREYRHEKER